MSKSCSASGSGQKDKDWTTSGPGPGHQLLKENPLTNVLLLFLFVELFYDKRIRVLSKFFSIQKREKKPMTIKTLGNSCSIFGTFFFDWQDFSNLREWVGALKRHWPMEIDQWQQGIHVATGDPTMIMMIGPHFLVMRCRAICGTEKPRPIPKILSSNRLRSG